MLTANQIGYLNTIPKDKIAKVVPFDSATQAVAQELISEIKSVLPRAEIFYIGSSKLGIAGKNDIDMTVMANGNFDEYHKVMEQIYGKPQHINIGNKYIKWELTRNNFPVELHLNDVVTPNFQEQLDTQKILENDTALRKEYEQLKIESNGLSWRHYMKRKYEFWNKILGIE